MDDVNWVVIVAHNNLDLLKGAVGSVRAQVATRPMRMLVVDNESTPDVGVWLRSQARAYGDVVPVPFYPQHSVSRAWNVGLHHAFHSGAERVLVINQDVVLRPDTWKWLEAEQAEFVTAVGSDNPGSILPLLREGPTIQTGIGPIRSHRRTTDYRAPRPDATRPHPDFSCFMISRGCYARVGPFDENFRIAFGEDCDLHVRMHAAGIHAYCIDLPFWHVGGGSQTVKRAGIEERERIMAQAARNREYFKQKWGFEIGSPEYYAFFGHEAPKEPTL